MAIEVRPKIIQYNLLVKKTQAFAIERLKDQMTLAPNKSHNLGSGTGDRSAQLFFSSSDREYGRLLRREACYVCAVFCIKHVNPFESRIPSCIPSQVPLYYNIITSLKRHQKLGHTSYSMATNSPFPVLPDYNLSKLSTGNSSQILSTNR